MPLVNFLQSYIQDTSDIFSIWSWLDGIVQKEVMEIYWYLDIFKNRKSNIEEYINTVQKEWKWAVL